LFPGLGSKLIKGATPGAQAVTALVIILVLAAVSPEVLGPVGVVGKNFSSLLWWLVLMAGAWGQGSILLRLLSGGGLFRNRELEVPVALGLGLGVLGLESFFLGLAGFFSTPPLTLLALISAATVLFSRKNHPFPKICPPEKRALLPLCLAGLGTALVFSLVFVPPTFFDAMSYHLELPSRYLQEGRIFHLAENLYSGYPQLAETLYGLGLALEGTALAGLLSLTSCLLVLFLLWEWGRKRFGDEGSAWGIAILTLCPPLLVLTGSLHNDWFAALFILGVVFILLEGSRRPGVMILAGVMAGLAAGCKYNALAFGIFAPLAAGVIEDLFGQKRFRTASWGLFLLAGCVTISPWLVKNLIFTGDPLYPLLAGLSGDVSGLGIIARDTHFRALTFSDFWRWTLVPFLAVFRPRELQFHASLGLLPIALLPTLFSLRGRKTGNRFLGLWALFYFFSWYLSFRVGRFLLPLISVAFLYLGAGLSQVLQTRSPFGRILKGVAVVMLVAGLGSFLGLDSVYLHRSGAASGMVAPEDFLRGNYHPYPAISFLNRLDPLPAKVLFVGEMRGFYSEFPREVPTFEMPNRLVEMVRQGTGPEEIRERLKKAGFSHILVNLPEMKRLAAKSLFLKLGNGESKALEEFLSTQARAVFEDKGVYVFEIF